MSLAPPAVGVTAIKCHQLPFSPGSALWHIALSDPLSQSLFVVISIYLHLFLFITLYLCLCICLCFFFPCPLTLSSNFFVSLFIMFSLYPRVLCLRIKKFGVAALIPGTSMLICWVSLTPFPPAQVERCGLPHLGGPRLNLGLGLEKKAGFFR